jgi:metal-responsive CopG/Arc/MetJ family transcriptional regulator
MYVETVMRKKIIQVPVDYGLLKELDDLSKKQGRSRSDLIREACAHYVAETEEAEKDKAYVESYRAVPEDAELGEALDKLAAEVLAEEKW